jgi:tetratricopeptide (TPR) repeat protein
MTALAANDPARIAGLSPTATRLLATAAQAISAGKLDKADDAFAGVLALAPHHPEVLRLLGVLRQLQRNPGQAIDALREALALRPNDALIHSNLGSALRANGEVDAAITELRRACDLAPQLDGAWFNLGKTLKSQSRMEEACDALERAITCNPAHDSARIALAETLKALGRVDAAEAMYRSVLPRRANAAQAWYGLANLKTLRFQPIEIEAMRTALAQAGNNDEKHIQLGFALAKAYEDAGDYARSFAVLSTANARKRRLVDWNRNAFSASIDALIEADLRTPTFADAQLGGEVIFIVSLPRSGSTLTEQILAAHPDVEGAGELSHLPEVLAEESARRGAPLHEWMSAASALDWRRLGEEYLRRTARWRNPRPRFTDKGLNNWFHIGAAIRMLPAAHIVCCRRDPLETVFSCFRQLFAKGQDFSYAIDDTVAYWRDYDRLVRHFHQRHPLRIFEQVYEALLAEPETQTRHLLDACGLPFDPRCLRSHESRRHVRTASAAQVRQPLRSDTARAPRYGELLQSIRDQLEMRRDV